MLYLGIDQHARQITISLRDDSGDVLQVSTRPEKIQAFFANLTRDRITDGESFIAVVEVCGFNDWLIQLLRDYRCHKVILIQPEERKKRKTDRRDGFLSTPDRLAGKQVLRGHRDDLKTQSPVVVAAVSNEEPVDWIQYKPRSFHSADDGLPHISA